VASSEDQEPRAFGESLRSRPLTPATAAGRAPAQGLTSSQRLGQQGLGARRWRPGVDEAEAPGGEVIEIIRDRESGHQRQLLEDAHNASRVGGGRRGEADIASGKAHAAASGCTTPAMILISVDLPAPFSPSTAWISRAPQAKSTPSRARTPP